MAYIEKLLHIPDTKEMVIRTKAIPMVKVLRKNHALEEAAWGVEAEMSESKVPGAFSFAKFGDKIFFTEGRM